MQEALSQACEKMTPVVRPVIVTCPFEGANLVFARIDEMLPRDKPCFTTALDRTAARSSVPATATGA